MDNASQPIYTQAMPVDDTQTAASSFASTSSQPIPSAFTSTATNGFAPPPASSVAAAHFSQPIASTSAIPDGASRFEPFPEQSPSNPPLTGFQSIASRAAELPNAQPYRIPPSYEAPAFKTGAGLSEEPPIRRVLSAEEAVKVGPDGVREPGTVLEDEVTKLSVAEVYRSGFGRHRSGYCYAKQMTLHAPLAKFDTDDDRHPEQPARILGIHRKLENGGLLSRMQQVAVREVVREEVMLVHSEGHWDRVRATGFQTIEYLETCKEFFERLSLYVNTDSAYAARLSCGGVIEMCRAVAEGQIRNGFAIVRPPGHHAEPEEAMGFCFFNNAAVAAKWLRTVYGSGEQKDVNGKPIRMNRILILDWDVHHGNGTQRAFENDADILYISLHRHSNGFYPGGDYGAKESVGSGAGRGFSVNIPFPHEGMGDADYIYAFQQIVMPIAYEFAPDFVIVSAGYDAAKGDDLGKMLVSPDGYAHMTNMLESLAGGKLVLALEGGYNVNAIAESAHACVKVIVGDELPQLAAIGAASLSATNTVHEVKQVQSGHWKCMGVAVESAEDLNKAGKIESLSEILKAHRVYELFHEYELFNVEISNAGLQDAFRDQLLVSQADANAARDSENVYDAEVLVVFMHDLGSLKAAYTAATLDSDLERTQLLDTSRLILDWALVDHAFGVVDVNFLAHLQTVKGQPIDPSRNRSLEKELALYIWDNLVSLSSAQHVVLVGSGAGCAALVDVVKERGNMVAQRVRACVSVLGHETPPELSASSGVRPWYKNNSLVLLPSTHPLHEQDAKKLAKSQKKYGGIVRATAEDESRPTHLLKASLPRIKAFVESRLPKEALELAPVGAASTSGSEGTRGTGGGSVGMEMGREESLGGGGGEAMVVG
ncbi:hypothetical protein JCM11641_005556 [Rhodosporidiobolus odoratus]